jgi:hypothetical protein
VCGSRGISLVAGGGMRIEHYKVTQPSRKDHENTEKEYKESEMRRGVLCQRSYLSGDQRSLQSSTRHTHVLGN